MATIIRDYKDGQSIADAETDDDYTFEELDNAKLVDYFDDVNGWEKYELTDGRLVTLQSIDLDWVAPYDDAHLRTASSPHLYQ